VDIGIIGGADGPTVIFLARSTTSGITAIIAVVIVGLAAFVIWRRKKTRRKNERTK
jgi:LPXTG-motif cell wall-anchored protein